MTPLFLSLCLLLGTLLIGEGILWRMFRRRVDPIIFPSERNTSETGPFRPWRMRAFAVSHTVSLGAWTLLSVLWLW